MKVQGRRFLLIFALMNRLTLQILHDIMLGQAANSSKVLYENVSIR